MINLITALKEEILMERTNLNINNDNVMHSRNSGGRE